MSDFSDYTAFHRRLQRWYDNHGRKTLPWRNTRDAYAIYISETMLQQTQVKTVLERYYFPFLERFPTLSHLAAADGADVLSAWQGLGYYNRANNLHKAAKQCGGALPDTVDELLALPGIGRNTAHAVAAFAGKQAVPVMEANVKRVLCRIFAISEPQEKELWEKAYRLLDTTSPFDYNQAMMDIGAMVCTKRAPDCASCPANIICQGKTAPEQYPAAKAKKTVPVRKKTILILRSRNGRYYATPRETRFLSGLYHFVEMDRSPPEKFQTLLTEQGVTWIPALAGMTKLGSVRQQYSHFTLEAEVFFVPTEHIANDGFTFAELKRLPFSNAEHKILALLEAPPSANCASL